MKYKIPKPEYRKLLRKAPDLASEDKAVQLAAWKRFEQDPASLPFRIENEAPER